MAHNHFNTTHVWPVYIGPACYYARRVDIGIHGNAARKTNELVSRPTVFLLRVSARAAFAGSVPRIDVADWNACTLGLVDDLRLEVCKGPRVQASTLSPGSSYPAADALEVFQSNSTTGAFGGSNDPLGNHMVDVLRKVSLFAATFFQKLFGTFRPFSLKLCTKLVGPSAKAVGMRARELRSVAGRCYVDDSDVHTQPIENFSFLRVGHVYGHEEVKLLLTKNEISLSSVKLKKFALMIAADEGDVLPAAHRPYTHRLTFLPRENASIVCDRPKGAKYPLRFPVELVSVGHLGNGAHHYLSREDWKYSAALGVGGLLQRVLPPRLRRPGLLGKPVARGIGVPKGCLQHRRLFSGWQKFDLGDQLHWFKYRSGSQKCNPKGEALPPRPEGRGFRAKRTVNQPPTIRGLEAHTECTFLLRGLNLPFPCLQVCS